MPEGRFAALPYRQVARAHRWSVPRTLPSMVCPSLPPDAEPPIGIGGVGLGAKQARPGAQSFG